MEPKNYKWKIQVIKKYTMYQHNKNTAMPNRENSMSQKLCCRW